jgi:ABC-type Na+ transport system ATPase subunit NatA
MAQRLGIAAALLGEPGVIMLDEPVNGLDPEGVRWNHGLLKSLSAKGRAVPSWQGLAMLCLYAAVALAAGCWVLARRDA